MANKSSPRKVSSRSNSKNNYRYPKSHQLFIASAILIVAFVFTVAAGSFFPSSSSGYLLQKSSNPSSASFDVVSEPSGGTSAISGFQTASNYNCQNTCNKQDSDIIVLGEGQISTREECAKQQALDLISTCITGCDSKGNEVHKGLCRKCGEGGTYWKPYEYLDSYGKFVKVGDCALCSDACGRRETLGIEKECCEVATKGQCELSTRYFGSPNCVRKQPPVKANNEPVNPGTPPKPVPHQIPVSG